MGVGDYIKIGINKKEIIKKRLWVLKREIN